MKAELVVRKKMRLKKNNVYIVRLYEQVKEILADTEIMNDGFTFTRTISKELVNESCCKRAYLRGAFLAGDRSITLTLHRIIWRYSRFTKSITGRCNN